MQIQLTGRANTNANATNWQNNEIYFDLAQQNLQPHLDQCQWDGASEFYF